MPSLTSSRQEVDRVRRYYEQHTHAFVAYGQGGAMGAIHRAVHGPGVTTKAAAFHYVEDLIIKAAQTLKPHGSRLEIVDLGCGVGGSLAYLAQQLDINGTGITLSPTQARMASERFRAAGLSSRLQALVADYCDLPSTLPPIDVAFAIESFVHAPNPRRFFAEAARVLRPGGLLMICDDFRRDVTSREAEDTIARFCRGWHVNSLLTLSELRALAAQHDLECVSTTDLSAFVEIGRTRDRVIDLIARPLERLPWRWSRLDPWLGGSALQHALRHGWIGYEFVVFLRAARE